MLKVRAILLVFVLSLFSISAMAQDTIEIDFYYPSAIDANVAEIMQGYIDEFEAANPGITVNPVYTGSYVQTREVIQTELAAEDVIVDVAVMLSIDLYSFLEEESIVPLQDFIDGMDDGDAYTNQFFPAFLSNSIDEEGAIWSVPFQRSTPILYYNVELLEEAGIEVPTNNEELIAAAQALTTEDRWGLMVPVAGTFPIWMFESFANAYGSPLTSADNPAQVNLNTPETLEAVTFLTKLGMSVEDGGFGVGPMGGSAWGETPTAFINGDAAMIYHTTGSLTSILSSVEESENPFTVGTAFLPSGPAGDDGTGYGAPTGGGNLYIFSDSTPEQQDAAWKWVQFLSSAQTQASWGAATGYIAATDGAWDADPLAGLAMESPQYAVAREQLEFASKEFSSYRTIDVQGIINNTLSQIISGAVALEEAAATLESGQAQIDSLLADYE